MSNQPLEFLTPAYLRYSGVEKDTIGEEVVACIDHKMIRLKDVRDETHDFQLKAALALSKTDPAAFAADAAKSKRAAD